MNKQLIKYGVILSSITLVAFLCAPGRALGSAGEAVLSFLGLGDTPASYVGESGQCAAVNGTEDGLEFVTCGGGASSAAGLWASSTDDLVAYPKNGSGGDQYAIVVGGSASTTDVQFQVTASSTEGYFAVSGTGGNDYFKVNQLGQVVVAETVGNSATSPSLAFGDGDTGFYEGTDDILRLSVEGSNDWIFGENYFVAQASDGPAILNESPSATNPTIVPDKGSLGTGVGSAAAGQLSLIAGDTEGVRIETGTTTIKSTVFEYKSSKSITLASTTLDSISPSGTSTIPIGPAAYDETWNFSRCFTDTGTANVQIGDGTNNMNTDAVSTTVNAVTLSSNNTFIANEKRYINVGSRVGTPNFITCNYTITNEAQ